MREYQDLLADILAHGSHSPNRTGVDTIKTFGQFLSFDLADGLPVLTTKKVHFKSVVGELLWFLSGSMSAKVLREKYGVTIWDEWQDEDGNLGPVYGKQWRDWDAFDHWENPGAFAQGRGVDQVAQVINEIRTNPDSRRLVVSAWNPTQIPAMRLPPCHMIYQFQVQDGYLSCLMNQRSVDAFLGLPFNIASYGLLTCMVAHVTGYKPGTLHLALGDTHIYQNHLTQVGEQLSREPRALPTLWLNPVVQEINQFTPDDIKLMNYDPHPSIKAEVAV